MESSCCTLPHTKHSAAALFAFLERLQEVAPTTLGSSEFDAKYYIDLSLKFDLSETEKAFEELTNGGSNSVSYFDLKYYIQKYFHGPGEDLDEIQLPDYMPEPEDFLPEVKNPTVRTWALKVHALWRKLSRKVSASVSEHEELHTVIPLPYPFIIPGSRFVECYYWDSYWVIRGLLASKMCETAKGIVMNLIYLLWKFGHVLNGNRIYYTNRSQPPLLSAMARAVYERTGDKELAKTALTAIQKEHEFWTSSPHAITVRHSSGCHHRLSRYYAFWDKPRPESSVLDKRYGSGITDDENRKNFYREVASAAESGWDFSTRLLRKDADFTTLSTTSIVPVDLNAFVLRMELDIAFFAKETGMSEVCDRFVELSMRTKNAIDSVLWNEEKGQWLDYWIDRRCLEGEEGAVAYEFNGRNQNENVYASNFVPLWIDAYHSDDVVVAKVVKGLKNSGLVLAGGIAMSLKNSGRQWDFPNGWAPLEHMIVEGLTKSNSEEAKSLGRIIALRWIRSNFEAYEETGHMHEKYDVDNCGKAGGGGEYFPQTGFGWSNGVVLSFLEEFGWPVGLPVNAGAGTTSFLPP